MVECFNKLYLYIDYQLALVNDRERGGGVIRKGNYRGL